MSYAVFTAMTRAVAQPGMEAHADGRTDAPEAVPRIGWDGPPVVALHDETERAAEVLEEVRSAKKGKGGVGKEQVWVLFAGPPAFEDAMAWKTPAGDIDRDRIMNWARTSVDWLRRGVEKASGGLAIVQQAHLHAHEKSPHIHAVVVPIMPPSTPGPGKVPRPAWSRLQAEWSGHRRFERGMSALQDSYHAEVEGFGLMRGVRRVDRHAAAPDHIRGLKERTALAEQRDIESRAATAKANDRAAVSDERAAKSQARAIESDERAAVSEARAVAADDRAERADRVMQTGLKRAGLEITAARQRADRSEVESKRRAERAERESRARAEEAERRADDATREAAQRAQAADIRAADVAATTRLEAERVTAVSRAADRRAGSKARKDSKRAGRLAARVKWSGRGRPGVELKEPAAKRPESADRKSPAPGGAAGAKRPSAASRVVVGRGGGRRR